MEDNEIVAFQLWDANGKLVASKGEVDIDKLKPLFQINLTENFKEAGLRNIYRKTEDGSVRFIVKQNASSFQGTKGIARACAIYLSFIPRFKQLEGKHRQHFDAIIKRFAHNLIKFQVRFKGNFTRLISDPARARPFNAFHDEVKRRIEANTSAAAKDVCEMSHRAVDLDAQIETLRIISGYADSPLLETKIRSNLQKGIFRLTNPFIDELTQKNITVNLNIPPVLSGDDKVLIAPSLFNAAVWQLLDNASKYTLNGTQINITAVLNEPVQKLEISMISVCIDEDEEELVFLEGRVGKHAGTKGESGIGLFIVRKALSLMNAKIRVKNEGFVRNENGFKYCNHKFTVEFER